MNYSFCKVKRPYCCLLGVGVFLSANTLNAMDYSYDVSIPYSVIYDSNIQLVEDNERSVLLHTINPGVTLRAADELNVVSIGAGLRVQRSSNKDISQDREDPNFSAGWVREFTNGQFNANTSYSKTSSRVSELRRSGFVTADGSAVSKSVNLGFSYFLTDRYTLSSGVGYQQQVFTGAGLSDYNSKNFNAKLSYEYNDALVTFMQYSINQFEDITLQTSSVSNQYSAGINAQLTPKFTLTSFLGINHIGGEGSGWIGSANVDYLLTEKSTFTTSLSRSVNASGAGGFLKSDSLSASYGYQVNEYDKFGADIGWNINRALNDNRFKQFNVWYSRDLAERWSARTFVQYRTLSGLNSEANGYQVGLSVNYNISNF